MFPVRFIPFGIAAATVIAQPRGITVTPDSTTTGAGLQFKENKGERDE